MVLSVKSSISSGNFKTTLECQWQSSGLPSKLEKDPIKPVVKKEDTPPSVVEPDSWVEVPQNWVEDPDSVEVEEELESSQPINPNYV